MRPRLFAALLVLGLALRVAGLPLPRTEDVDAWKIWSDLAARDVNRGWGWAVPRTLTRLDLSVLVAFVNVAALLWFGHFLTAEVRTSA